MTQRCLFCDNASGNAEHLWAKWIHDRKNFGPIRMKRGLGEDIIIPDPQITVKSVCATCNNGWMSDLEARNIPVIGGMMKDIAMTLDRRQQESVAAWAMKTAMVTDSTRSRKVGNRFFTKAECVGMRENLKIPPRTRIWIGRISSSHLNAGGTDFTIHAGPERARTGTGSVANIVVGHFVAQVITQHTFGDYPAGDIPDMQPKYGDWENQAYSDLAHRTRMGNVAT